MTKFRKLARNTKYRPTIRIPRPVNRRMPLFPIYLRNETPDGDEVAYLSGDWTRPTT